MAGVLLPVGFGQLGVKRTHHSTTTICQVFNLLQIQHVHGKRTRTGRLCLHDCRFAYMPHVNANWMFDCLGALQASCLSVSYMEIGSVLLGLEWANFRFTPPPHQLLGA